MYIKYKVLFACFILAIVWLIIYLSRKDLRKDMLWSSLLCAPLGLFEPVWFKYYWDPRPTLFDLTARTGFDIESILLMFLLGGLAGGVYEVLFKKKLVHSKDVDVRLSHLFIVFLFTYVVSQFLFKINAIYSTYLGVFSSLIVVAIIYPKYLKIFFYGGLSFMAVYISLFIIFAIIFPGYVDQVYAIGQISQIKILFIPLEEWLFALFFGGMWAIVYPLAKGYVPRNIGQKE